jgi:hypothetical protein
VLVAQHERRVEVYTRGSGGRWILDDVTGDGIANLEAIGCELALDEVYLKLLEPGGASVVGDT